MHDSFSENVDFWVKTLYQEANETINDIWSNARPFANEFLDDIRYVFLFERTKHMKHRLY